MAKTKADLLIHPIRIRIMTAMMGRRLTIGQIAELLPDIPLPSLYRHVRLLAESGVLKAVEEVRVRGAATKVYAVNPGGARITVEEGAPDPREEHMRGFSVFLRSLEESFRAYLNAHSIDLSVDPVQALMEPLTLSHAEFLEMREGLNDFLKAWRDRPMEGDRRRVIFAHAFLPDRPDPPRE